MLKVLSSLLHAHCSFKHVKSSINFNCVTFRRQILLLICLYPHAVLIQLEIFLHTLFVTTGQRYGKQISNWFKLVYLFVSLLLWMFVFHRM